MQNQKGGGNTAVVISLVVLLLASLGFGYWAFSGRQDYKNNTDKKVAVAVASGKTQQSAADKASYDELIKKPYKSFTGNATYGTISFSYPKTWSAYVDQTDANEPLNAYFYPGEVPGVNGTTAYPLRVELVNTEYSQVLEQYSSIIAQGDAKSAAYIPPKMAGVNNVQPGVRLDGSLWQDNDVKQKGSMVIIKVRDKTMQIYSQSPDFASDFNNIILPSLTFVP
jgi:hypothetical protein